MISIIGWSSVASAVQKPIHSMMMFQNSISQENNFSAHHVKANTDSNCHDTSPIEKNLLPHCDLMMVNETSSECSDCALWHCQIYVFSLDIYKPYLDALKANGSLEIVYSFYKEQHLKGHWQEILRPPKA
jgi:hypothetical protein